MCGGELNPVLTKKDNGVGERLSKVIKTIKYDQGRTLYYNVRPISLSAFFKGLNRTQYF